MAIDRRRIVRGRAVPAAAMIEILEAHWRATALRHALRERAC
jgi:hypothetical protein